MKTSGIVLDFINQVGGASPSTSLLSDSSRYKKNGTLSNISWTQISSGLWLPVFNGTNSSVDFGAHEIHQATKQFTVLCWIGLSDLTTTGHVIISKEGPLITNYEWAFYLYDDDGDNNYHLHFNITDNGDGGDNAHRQFSECANQINDTGYYCLIVVMDLSLATTEKIKYFVNGEQQTTTLDAGNWITSIYQGSADLRIGESERISGSGWTLKGYPASMILKRYAITPNQARTFYQRTKWMFEL